MKVGKISETILKRSIFKQIRTKRDEVLLGAGVGEDCAAVKLEPGEVFVISTDPITGTVKDIGTLAVQVTVNDLASSGAEPIGIMLTVLLPEEITEELIKTIAEEPKVCHYLDIPIQHASDQVLKRMGRHTTQEELRKQIGRLRERIPDICLRTTLISGFPGETQEDFEELYRFVNEMEFDRLGVFPYSREEDTAADLMPEQIAQEIKECRRDELMELQQAIVCDKADEMLGQELTAMIEGKIANEDVYVARTYRDAPNVDGYLFVSAGRNLETGDFVKVLVTDSREYDLIGELAEDREDNS